MTIYAVVHDVSEGGLFVRTSAPLVEGQPIKVRLSLADEEEEIHAQAVVVWQRAGTDSASAPAGMGIRLEQIEPRAVERIRRYVNLVSKHNARGD